MDYKVEIYAKLGFKQAGEIVRFEGLNGWGFNMWFLKVERA